MTEKFWSQVSSFKGIKSGRGMAISLSSVGLAVVAENIKIRFERSYTRH